MVLYLIIIIENYLKDYSLIEVKYRDKINISKTDAINKYSNNFQVNIVVTKKDDDFKLIERKDSNILLIPAYAFLYLIGYAENQNYNSFELL